MFTGIVETTGTIEKVDRKKSGLGFSIRPRKLWHEKLRIGESIAVDGVCLTVVRVQKNSFFVDVVSETLQATTLGKRSIGDCVNLERSLRLGDSLGGHFVFGHVDATGKIAEKKKRGDDYLLTISTPFSIMKYLTPKGSVGVDGISLTIQKIYPKTFQVAIIPHTALVTSLGWKGSGDLVNIEIDMMAKQVYQYLNQFKIRSKH